MIKRTFLLLALAGFANAAEIDLPNPGFEFGSDHAENWGSFNFGEHGSVSRMRVSRLARTGSRAYEISVHGGDGGQGIYSDVPVAGLKEGDVIEFSVHAKSKDGKPMTKASVGLHVEFLDGSGDDAKILARTDTLGTSTFVGSKLSGKFQKRVASHTVRTSDIPQGLSAVKVLRFVIVALQPEDGNPRERLGAVIVDDASVELKRRGN